MDEQRYAFLSTHDARLWVLPDARSHTVFCHRYWTPLRSRLHKTPRFEAVPHVNHHKRNGRDLVDKHMHAFFEDDPANRGPDALCALEQLAKRLGNNDFAYSVLKVSSSIQHLTLTLSLLTTYYYFRMYGTISRLVVTYLYYLTRIAVHLHARRCCWRRPRLIRYKPQREPSSCSRCVIREALPWTSTPGLSRLCLYGSRIRHALLGWQLYLCEQPRRYQKQANWTRNLVPYPKFQSDVP